MTRLRRWIHCAAAITAAAPAFAGFSSTETFLPAVGRVSGQGGAQFYTTMWATNLTPAPVSFTFDFLEQGQANTSPISFADTLAPGQTKVYENVIESKLGLASGIGAARIVSTGEILVSERIYDQPPGGDTGNSQGLFFAGVPKSFSISAGQSASIQGINQGGVENFRYNFALVETGGGSPTVSVQLFDGDGGLLGEKGYVLQPYEQIQPNVTDVFPGIATTNARVIASVTGGTGSVLLAGAQLANGSQDSSGFEMSFRNELLGAGGIAGVTSLNGLAGALTIASGANTTVNVNGRTITIDAVSGSGTGLTAVAHDSSLFGSGTAAVPLGIAPGQAVRSVNGLHDAVTLSPGNGISVTTNGNSIQIASTGGGSGGITAVTHDATLTGQGTGASPLAVSAPLVLTASADVDVITGQSTASTGSEAGVLGTALSPSAFGVHGHGSHNNTDGYLGGNDYGVYGVATDASGIGVYGTSSSGVGVKGIVSDGSGAGVYGYSAARAYVGTGVYGNGGLYGVDATGQYAVHAVGVDAGVLSTGNSVGVDGETSADHGIGVFGSNTFVDGYAAIFVGDVVVNGVLNPAGVGAVKFDDPADPANRTITHAFVGSSEMKNIYDGIATLGPSGTATVPLPGWLETVNKDFRYQLTALGTPQAGLYISRKIANNQFTIAGGVPGAEVSWQITGVRRDPWASKHPIEPQVYKSDSDRGLYIVPELYGQPQSQSIIRIVRQRALRAAAADSGVER